MLKKILTIALIVLVVAGVGVGTYFLVNSLTGGSTAALPVGAEFRGGHMDGGPFAGRGGFEGRGFDGRGFDGRRDGFAPFGFGGGILSGLGLIALITLAVLGVQSLWARLRRPKAAPAVVETPPAE